jgi:hypothetical protein
MAENISYNDNVIPIIGVSSRMVYSLLLSNISEDPTAKINIERNYGTDIWESACENIYKTSIDTYLRNFQYKIIHNFLPVNKKLYTWKLVDSPRCSYCFTEIETLEHLFCECSITKTFYLSIREWCKTFNVKLPQMNITTILYGFLPPNINNALVNSLILLYKQIVYNSRLEKNNLTLNVYKLMVDKMEYMERKINISKMKNLLHCKKWKQYNNITDQKAKDNAMYR